MARSLPALVLIVALLVCPYTCRAGECGCCAIATAVAPSAGSCPHGCCADHEEPIGQNAPAPADPEGSCPDSCLCNGALPGGESQALNLALQACLVAWVVPADADSPICSLAFVPGSRADWRASGVALRVACCSWLC